MCCMGGIILYHLVVSPYHPGIAILEQSLVCTGREAGCNTKDPRQPVVCPGSRTHVGVVVGTVTLTVNSEVSEGGMGREMSSRSAE